MRLFTLQLVASVRRMSLLNKLIRSFPSSLLHGRRSQDALIVVSPKQHDGNQGLATELLVEILSYLGHRDLIRCRRVSIGVHVCYLSLKVSCSRCLQLSSKSSMALHFCSTSSSLASPDAHRGTQ